jgi:hypothetical protein
LQLVLPVLDAIEQSQRVYGTRVPADVMHVLRRAAISPWPRWMRAWLFDHALRPALLPHSALRPDWRIG